MRVAIIAPGEMGAAVGARLRRRGAGVATSLAGRSRASAERARCAGFEVVDGDDRLVDEVGVVLSIVPPAQALPLAERLAPALARAGGRVVYADCNAVAPETVRRIAGVVAAAGCPFADVGISAGRRARTTPARASTPRARPRPCSSRWPGSGSTSG